MQPRMFSLVKKFVFMFFMGYYSRYVITHLMGLWILYYKHILLEYRDFY